MKRILLALLLILAVGLSCRRAPPPIPDAPAPEPWFEDVTARSGLDFVHDAGPTDGNYFTPQIMGSGAALFDFDGDGRLDIYLVNNGGPKGRPNQLFRQREDKTFEDVSKGSGLDFAGHCMGVAIGDVNNDGLPDVLVTMYRGVKLFLNKGNGTFEDVTAKAGLDNPNWAMSAAFFDYDRDGWLDLVVANYIDVDASASCTGRGGKRDYCGPKIYPGTVSRLFRNKGAGAGGGVAFEDVTVKSGLARLSGPGLGVVCMDFDGDGWPDIFVTNDAAPNHLWINQHDGTFKESAALRGLAYNGMGATPANMGVAVGDVDGDGLFDLFTTQLTQETHTLWRQDPRGLFRDATAQSGMANAVERGTGWGTVLADFDHDGALDLAIVNGRVERGRRVAQDTLGPFWSWYGERNQLFAGDGKGRFSSLSKGNAALCGAEGNYRGLAVGDVDGDGALDLLVTGIAGKVQLLRNVAPSRGHWLSIRAVDPALKRDAYGAEITVHANGRRWLGWVNPGFSYLCSNDPRAHFGLGQAKEVESIHVRWPDATAELFPGGAVDRRLTLVKGKGKPAP